MDTKDKRQHPDNLKMLEILQKKLDEMHGPRVGDYIQFSDGYLTRITEVEEDHVQTGGEKHSSYHLGSNGCSYSGGLDPGININELRITKETRAGSVWFFHLNESKADNAVHYQIPFRVYIPSENADLSGCYSYLKQKEKKEREAKQKTADTITMSYSGDQKKQIHLPEIWLFGIAETAAPHLKLQTQMEFLPAYKDCQPCLIAQPQTHQQLLKLFLHWEVYNARWDHENNILKIKRVIN
jgi:hypothetical protein